MPSEFYGIVVVEVFKEMGEGVGTMRTKEELSSIKQIQRLGFLRSE